MTDHLVEIKIDELPKLRELYAPAKSMEEGYIGLMTIDTYIQWFQQEPALKNIRFFCLNGDYSDGTFLVTHRYSAYADTLNQSYDRLARLLRLIDYSKGYAHMGVRNQLATIVTGAIQAAGIEIASHHTIQVYHLPKEKALELTNVLPEGLALGPVEKFSDIVKANAVWPHRHPHSELMLAQRAKYNPSVGAFINGDEMVAWIFRLPIGFMGALQTDDQHVGKGYATIVVKEISRQIAQLGHDIYAGIFPTNTPSRRLFEKLGFKVVGESRAISTPISWTAADDE